MIVTLFSDLRPGRGSGSGLVVSLAVGQDHAGEQDADVHGEDQAAFPVATESDAQGGSRRPEQGQLDHLGAKRRADGLIEKGQIVTVVRPEQSHEEKREQGEAQREKRGVDPGDAGPAVGEELDEEEDGHGRQADPRSVGHGQPDGQPEEPKGSEPQVDVEVGDEEGQQDRGKRAGDERVEDDLDGLHGTRTTTKAGVGQTGRGRPRENGSCHGASLPVLASHPSSKGPRRFGPGSDWPHATRSRPAAN